MPIPQTAHAEEQEPGHGPHDQDDKRAARPRAVEERDRAQQCVLEEVLNEDTLPPLEDVIGRFAERVESLLGSDGPLRLAPAGWVEAMYNPALGPTVRGLFTDTRTWWIKLAERMRDVGRLPADADPRAVGATLFCLVPGFVIQLLILEDVDAATLREGLRALTG
ncbi:TetR family transcriptional regulator C-terminal domain-containing protein [Actinoallomurus soli]|uniref:TetR family transcriptional regulator C-terminal domain-containing protein n=1 Tax=Actinoallomurus soli TaxID=2952535 RepID=UPI0020938DF1|nr:TetR family transcriptional regulator C-terminal domain-containing protein [Actinoallomurus soli]MCO5966847.1 TetR family transcriptional regulator C-terminal domain-containing protein [Actinoallomurus soli]